MTQMKRHRQQCSTWKSRDRGAVQGERLKATLVATYGVETLQAVPEVEAKRRATLKAKYGAENIFSRESSVFDKVQASLEGKRPVLKGANNPFARPEVQAKIREHNQRVYGVDHNMQSPEVRAKAKTTNLKRFGTEESLAAPIVRGKIRATCEDIYGGPAPACAPDVKERARTTNQERWGVDWTSMHPTVREKQHQTMLDNYGTHYLASEEGRAQVKKTLIERYGVDHPSKIEGFWEKSVATFIRKYGVAHPLVLAEFLEKRRVTCLERYGVEYPMQNPQIILQSQEALRKACLQKYGVPNAMQVPEIALKALKAASSSRGPNLLERRFASANPQLMYTGDGSFWRWLPKLGHHKNPDFIFPGPVKSNPKKGVVRVVEVFGDYWHSRMFTGNANFDHEQELVEAFADIGIQCLIVWESQFKADPVGVKARVHNFLETL